MFTLEQIDSDNYSHYSEYDKAFEKELKDYQSRIYPTKDAVVLSWYHIKIRKNISVQYGLKSQ